MTDLRVAPVGRKAALYAVKQWHYSRCLPLGPLIVLGVFEDDVYVGCVIFSHGTGIHVGDRWNLRQHELCELTRIALSSHQTPVSQLVATSLRWLKAHNPNLRMVVSFADPAEGHHGGIYQAGNWLYLGRSKPILVYRDKTGRIWHNRLVSKTGVKDQFGKARKSVRAQDCVAILQPGKHRYLMPLDKAMRRRVLPFAEPFPLPCDRSLDGETPGRPPGNVGSTPADRSEPTEAVHA